MNRPCIRIYDEKQHTEIVFDDLFRKKQNIPYDLKTLIFIWNDLLKDDNQMSIDDKHIEIADFFGGKRYRNDILEMIYYLQSGCDIKKEELVKQFYNEIVEKEDMNIILDSIFGLRYDDIE